MKKRIFLSAATALSSLATAQVGIGLNAVPTNDYVSIEFGTPAPAENKGILLPWVTSAAAASASPVGTLIFDASAKKILLGSSGSSPSSVTAQQTTWLDLSNSALTPTASYTNPTTASDNSANAKVVINAAGSPVNGILILETPNADSAPKAMVLPRVNSVDDIISPSAGMIVYVKNRKLLATYNGAEWSFWSGTP